MKFNPPSWLDCRNDYEFHRFKVFLCWFILTMMDLLQDISDVMTIENDEADDACLVKSLADKESHAFRAATHTRDTFDVKDVISNNILHEIIDPQDRISKSQKWLQDHVMPPYWSENVSHSSSTNNNFNRSSRLLSDWWVGWTFNLCLQI